MQPQVTDLLAIHAMLNRLSAGSTRTAVEARRLRPVAARLALAEISAGGAADPAQLARQALQLALDAGLGWHDLVAIVNTMSDARPRH